MVLQLENWHLQRGSDVSIGPLNLDFGAGTVTTLIGPSGVGKTTLLMTILGYEESGLTINGQRKQEDKILATGTVPKRALYIPQHLPFNPNWEVQGFLRRLPWGKSNFIDLLLPVRSEHRKRVDEVLQQLGLAHRARATIAELSGGEAQRAALAQMLLLKPKVLIGDEFVSALDPGMTTWILDQCRQEISQSNGAAILALHDVQAAMHVSDRILLLWSANIGTQPWEIMKGSPAWHGEVLYSLACLARWAKDSPGHLSLRELISRINSWLSNERSLYEFLNAFKDEETLIIDDAGNTTAMRDGIEKPFHPNVSSDNWTDMMPVRLSKVGMQQIGISIPRGSKKLPLTVLANVKIPVAGRG